MKMPPLKTLFLQAALTSLVAGAAGEAHAQVLPGSGGAGAASRPSHVRWEVTVEPAELPPGGKGAIVARYRTAPGWHLYAPDHTSPLGVGLATAVAADAPAVEIEGPPAFPEPKVDRVEELGETHRLLEGEGTIRQGFRLKSDAPPGELSFNALLSFMTCDANGCDPPTRRSPHPLKLKVAASGTPEEAPSPATVLEGLTPSLDPASRAAPAHVTWTVTVEPAELRRGERGEIVAAYELARGWHLYAPDHKSASEIGKATRVGADAAGITLDGAPVFPKPVEKAEPAFNETHRLLEGKGAIRQGFVVKPDTPPGPLEFHALLSYMTCADACDPPVDNEKHPVQVTVTPGPPVAGPPASAPPGAAAATPGDNLVRLGIWSFILAMIGGGLFALVMPCTYPMIPITFTFFTKLAEERQAAVLPMALAYGAGIVAVFNAIGFICWLAFIALGTKLDIVKVASNPWLNLGVGVIFTALALSLLGLFTLRLPSFLQNLAAKAGGMDGYLKVFLLGATLVITSFTCTAPVMGGLLALAVKDGSLGRVHLGMSVFGLTMALPFVILSLSPRGLKVMPRSGEWMHTVKIFLGFIELAAAIKFLQLAEISWKLGLLNREIFMTAWAAIFIAMALHLFGVLRFKDEQTQGIGTLRLLIGMLCLMFALYCMQVAERPDRRLGFIMGAFVPPYPYPGESVSGAWTIKTDLDEGLAAARAARKRALLNFSGLT